ncbi:MAG: RNA methyltransferase [Bacteroidota bacterium]|jgi:tRNA G18 (ribose-2'-O)-methylase SpoU|nr:RNA methyltransferase [Bacteroidota bacterium]
MRIVHITDLDHPDLEPYTTLRARTVHGHAGLCVAEGEKAVRAMIDAGIRVRSLLLSQRWADALATEFRRDNLADAVAYVAEDDVLEDIVGYPLHKSLMAMGEVPENPSMEMLRPTVRDTVQMADRSCPIIVAMEGIADAENMGMILRNCAAFGVAGVVVGSDSTSPYLRRSVRVSLGNVFRLRIHRTDRILESIRRYRDEYGWWIVGTTPRDGIPEIMIPTEGGTARPLCLLFGSEATGLTSEALALCDARFTIPMRNDVDSINVANAVAVALFAATR